MRTFSFRHKSTTRGFSTLELIVVVGIVGMMSALVLTSYYRSGSLLVLENSASDFVSRVREAQAYAMAVRRHSSDVYPSWGLYVDKANPTRTILYADLDKSGTYNTADTGTCGQAASECVSIVPLAAGVSIKSLCGTYAASETKAAVPGTCPAGSTSNYFDIFFKRPFSDIMITGDPDGGGPVKYEKSDITLISARGFQKIISINYASEMTIN